MTVPTSSQSDLHFGQFSLRGPHGPLWADGEVVELPRKPLALLWMLASRGGEVVTKDEVLAEVWPRVIVSEGAISASLRDLRRALGDDARSPRFIVTAHRIGYRFIAVVTNSQTPPEPVAPEVDKATESPDSLVGRAPEQRRLGELYDLALKGQRQIVFVTGEAGIGKSCLVDAFVDALESGTAALVDGVEAEALLIGHGQCIEHYGAGEPYLPILEAVTRLCRRRGGESLLQLLRQHAPTWVTQLPGLFVQDLHLTPVHSLGPSSVQRMLREMADVIDRAAAERPVVLVFEDMHWSDHSTVEWLGMLVRRRERARLLVIVTCRPVELIINEHPLKQVKQELVARHAATEIVLGYLGADDVKAYLQRRLQHRPTALALAAAVHRRSQGHPLFMVRMADDLQHTPDASTVVDELSLPCGVTDLIETQLARLGDEQLGVLEAASVTGSEFATASISAALQQPMDDVERLLETLAEQKQFIEPRGLDEWHDGTLCGRYGFRHDLYRDALYRRLGSARRVQLHALIAERLLVAYGAHSVDIAAELALHFEKAHDALRAAHHCHNAGEKALRRYAHSDALVHADKGLALLATQNGGADCNAAELQLQLTRGTALLATRGYSAPEVEATYTRALALGIGLNDSAAIGPALSGLYNLCLTRAAFAQVQMIADQVLALVEQRPDPVLSMLAHNVRGSAQLFAGEAAASLEHVTRTLVLYDADAHRHLAFSYGEDPAVACHHYATLANWTLGFAETAEQHLTAGFAVTRRLAHPFGEAQMLWLESLIALDDGDLDRVDRSTLRLSVLCIDHEFPLWLAGGQILRGGLLACRGQHEEGRLLTDQGLLAWRESGTLLTLPHALAVAARIQMVSGRIDRATLLLDEALSVTESTGEQWYTPELYRLNGELILQMPGAGPAQTALAQASFEHALTLARAQQARLFELRASASLAATWLAQGRKTEARSLLTAASARMIEGRQGRDMRRVTDLLASITTTA
jgi:DNA-binding winged helix-turn-helix (wHTH) protein/predicted ATPase